METSDLGPRRAGLLEAWGEYAEATAESEFHSFGSDNRHKRVSQRLEAFLDSPTVDRFQDLWTAEVLRDAVVGGPSLVLNSWPGTVEDLARQFNTMQAATAYDPAWEESFVATGALWELYGHMDPTSRPILNSAVLTGLDGFGFQKPHSYQDRTGYDRFATAYEAVVGHATTGTDHEVPWHFEIEQCLSMLGELDMETLTDELSEGSSESHLAGCQAEGNAGRIAFQNIEPLLDEYIQSRAAGGFSQEDTDTWGSNHWESWKWAHADHIQTDVRSTFDLTALDGADVEPFLAHAVHRKSNYRVTSRRTCSAGARAGSSGTISRTARWNIPRRQPTCSRHCSTRRRHSLTGSHASTTSMQVFPRRAQCSVSRRCS